MKNILTKTLFLSSLILIGSGTISSEAMSHEGEEHEHSHDAHSASKNNDMVLGSPKEIWTAIDSKVAELEKIIRAGELEKVHHEAFAIRDMTAALPAKSSELSPENLKKINANVKYVATLAERLDASGDAKDRDGVKAQYEKLIQVLKQMRGAYSDK